MAQDRSDDGKVSWEPIWVLHEPTLFIRRAIDRKLRRKEISGEDER